MHSISFGSIQNSCSFYRTIVCFHDKWIYKVIPLCDVPLMFVLSHTNGYLHHVTVTRHTIPMSLKLFFPNKVFLRNVRGNVFCSILYHWCWFIWMQRECHNGYTVSARPCCIVYRWSSCHWQGLSYFNWLSNAKTETCRSICFEDCRWKSCFPHNIYVFILLNGCYGLNWQLLSFSWTMKMAMILRNN